MGAETVIFWGLYWVPPPLSNSWIISIIWPYIALNRIPNIDCFWEGEVHKVYIILSLKDQDFWGQETQQPGCGKEKTLVTTALFKVLKVICYLTTPAQEWWKVAQNNGLLDVRVLGKGQENRN